MNRTEKIIKRVIDLVGASTVLLVFSPVFVVLFLALLLFQGSPVFFRQQRPGKGERIFTIWKFRTMSNARNSWGNLLPDAERLTPLGRWVRKTSLDEFPQLICVLKGDMSLVGPRPLLVRYLPLYNDYHRRRHEVKPGITGWAQVNGRNAIGWQKRLDLDVAYVENATILWDLKILWMTVKKVLKREGIGAARDVPTNRPFSGV
ncbi:sugar transferase [Cyclobacterium xiamenense]|uniref:sugar transferase n=1 Tax=Cyclobacterium xiamenense TaxID=1297121 RepID=UPI0012B6C251|nr:sugar transferase [Cyclobacterium xiamenense]